AAQAPLAYQPVRYASAVTATMSANAPPRSYGTQSPQCTAIAPSRAASSTQWASPSALIGSTQMDAPAHLTTPATNARVAEGQITALKCVLTHRKTNPVTPLHAEAWHHLLQQTKLLVKYPSLHLHIRSGFDAGIQPITFSEIVYKEISRGRYLGPLSKHEIETLIRPFQSSPISMVPKLGKLGKFCLVQNLSHPRDPTQGIPSINSHIDSNLYPYTWGTFSVISFLIWHLPPGSQAAVRDISEAYRSIPILLSQWPGLIVRLEGDDSFAIDTCDCFGLSSSAGLYGKTARDISANGGQKQDGGRLWFRGADFPDGRCAEFDEDASAALQDVSSSSLHSDDDALFTYNTADINQISDQLGLVWETSKDVPFCPSPTYIRFQWDIPSCMVALPQHKKEKYLQTIAAWQEKRTHTLEELQALYGKLLHASLVLPAGRAYLTELEAMLGLFRDHPFMPHSPPRGTHADLDWWTERLSTPSLQRVLPVQATVLPSQLRTAGEPRDFSLAGLEMAGISGEQKPLASSYSLARSFSQSHLDLASGSSAITQVLSKAGGGAAAETGKQTASLDVSSSFANSAGAKSIPATFLRPPIPWTAPPGASTLPSASSSLLSFSLLMSQTSSLTLTHLSVRESLLAPSLFPPSERHRITSEAPSLATAHPPSSRLPQPHLPHLTPNVSPLHPHYLCPLDHRGQDTHLSDTDISHAFDVLSHAWAESTNEAYGSGLLVFHIFCDVHNVPEAQRVPAPMALISSFAAALAGSYPGSTINNYIHGLDLNVPQDAAIFACLTTTFYAAACLGKFTVQRLNAFDPTTHVKPSDVRVEHDRNHLQTTIFFIPRTKSARSGEDVSWVRQDDPSDPEAAYRHHLDLNCPPSDDHLFAYQYNGSYQPLTKTCFLQRISKVSHDAELDPLQGHGICIGATLEYLLRGVPFDVMKHKGRWAFDVFALYLSKHAQIFAPYIQVKPELHSTFVHYTMPPVH
ncbi:hypothetical protein EW146_g10052, partial [Bondarzewia mesenterica]